MDRLGGKMAEQKVKVLIKRDGSGEVEFKLDGFMGEECTTLEELENDLGSVVERKDTQERFIHRNPDMVPNELSG